MTIASMSPSTTDPSNGAPAGVVVAVHDRVLAGRHLHRQHPRGLGVHEHRGDPDDDDHDPELDPGDAKEAPPLEHRRHPRLQARDRVAVVVGAEREERDDEHDLREHEQAVPVVPERAPRAELEVGGDDAGHEQRDDRADGHVGEPGHGPRRERPAVRLGGQEAHDQEGEAARPERGRDDVEDVGGQAERAQRAGVAGERRRQGEPRGERERQDDQRPPVMVGGMPQRQRRQRERRAPAPTGSASPRRSPSPGRT